VLVFVARRILYSIPVLLLASFLLFVFVRVAFDPLPPGLRNAHDPHAKQEFLESHGLNDPIVVQYGRWLRDAAHGDLGTSDETHEDVSVALDRAMGRTLPIIFWGVVVSAVLAIAIGVYSAVRQYSFGDHVLTGLSYVGIAMPPFWFGLIAIEIFVFRSRIWFGTTDPPLYSVGLHSIGETGFNLDYVRHLALPVATLCVQIVASWSRFERASMLDVLSADYVRTARAKGVPRHKVVFKHAMRSGLIPLVTVMALDIGALFGGLIVTEKIFSISGMGLLFYNSLLQGDAKMLEGWFLVVAVCIIVFNLLADVMYGVLDPRIRVS
jgi:peptide/nickel transport system permease protein